MEKVYEAEISAAEAARILLVLSERAYVWMNKYSVLAETLSGRRMVVSRGLLKGKYIFTVDQSLYSSENFWNEAFCGLDKARFDESEEEDFADVFDIKDSGVKLVGWTPPGATGDEYEEADYDRLCRHVGVTQVDLDAEKAEEMKILKKAVSGGVISKYEAEAIALIISRRIDRENLSGWSLRSARIDAIVEFKSGDILREFSYKIGELLPEPDPGHEKLKLTEDGEVGTFDEAAEKAGKPPRRKKARQ